MVEACPWSSVAAWAAPACATVGCEGAEGQGGVQGHDQGGGVQGHDQGGFEECDDWTSCAARSRSLAVAYCGAFACARKSSHLSAQIWRGLWAQDLLSEGGVQEPLLPKVQTLCLKSCCEMLVSG